MTFIFAWILADFISGIVHWAQDRLLIEPKSRFLKSVQADNELHHDRPAAMLSFTPLENINTSVIVAWPLALLLFIIGAPPVIWLAVFFASFGNLVHRFAHLPRAKLPRIIKVLQSTGVFISVAHHAKHHFDEMGVIGRMSTSRRYCPMTNWLNPILDRFGFFNFLETVFRRGNYDQAD